MQVAAYARVSSRRQAQAQTIEQQLDRLRAHAAAHGWALAQEHVFRDDGHSGVGHIDTVWKTRRHKGSCRTLGFSVDGAQLYSAGTDGIVKVADATTGQVAAKIAVPLDPYARPTPAWHLRRR